MLRFRVCLFSRWCCFLAAFSHSVLGCLRPGTTRDPWPLCGLPREGWSEVEWPLCAVWSAVTEVYPSVRSLKDTVQVQSLQQGCGGGYWCILYVTLIIVKCKCCYLFFFSLSALVWFAWQWILPCMWYLVNMIEIISPNFYKLPDVYLRVCWMIYFWKPQM